LEELGGAKIERDYLKVINIVKNSLEDTNILLKIYEKSPELTRVIFDFLFKKDPQVAWKNLKKDDYFYVSDILWNLPIEKVDKNKAKKIGFLSQLYSAKKYFDFSNKSKIFELDVLLNLKGEIADLDFEYVCVECKNIFPFSFSRCSNCLVPKSPRVEFVLTKKRGIDEENISV